MGVFGAVNSKSMPNPSSPHNFSVVKFSPALLHQIYLVNFPFDQSCLIRFTITWPVLFLCLRKNLKTKLVASLRARSQYFAPPKLLALMEPISTWSLSPGTSVLFLFGTSFGIFACLALAWAQLGHTSSLPVNFTLYYFAMNRIFDFDGRPKSSWNSLILTEEIPKIVGLANSVPSSITVPTTYPVFVSSHLSNTQWILL